MVTKIRRRALKKMRKGLRLSKKELPKKLIKGLPKEEIEKKGAAATYAKLNGAPPAIKRDLNRAKKRIQVFKRKGGTVQFVKQIRAIRNRLNDRSRKIRMRAKTHRIMAVRAKTLALAQKNAKEGETVTMKEAMKVKRPHRYRVVKMRHVYETQLNMRRMASKNYFKPKVMRTRGNLKLRNSLKPGTVCILLAGRYKCKRVVFLKQLKKTGLCLVTGPYAVNGVPMRRICHKYLIATSVRLDMKDVKMPKHITDSYFTAQKGARKAKKTVEEDCDFLRISKKGPTPQRVADQKSIDRQLLAAIKARKDKKVLTKYLKSEFGLRGKRFIHNMKF
ncbi:60S ribosomal protein L6-like [Hyalella azteca]|uniref:Large ribosomal subunit protein eL6 n=1 Tax=Hyalella azteca TaxID=294128 RepID=A0A979FLZ7_HYAAZ|nr:60S ribosomal protein L6-like [Hyalella azteca]